MWLSVLLTLLQVAKALSTFMQQRQLLEAGKAAQIKDNLDASLTLLTKANAARADAVNDFDKHGVHDNDPNLRD